MTIHYQPNRQGMTVLPDDIDDATGERIENTSQVVDTRFTAFAKDEEPNEYDPDLAEELKSDDPDHPEYVSEEERMADTQQDILTAEERTYNETLATSVSSLDLGDSPAAITVQHLTTQYYLGNISRDEAFTAAIESGIEPDKLMFAYWQLKNHFE